MRTARVLTAMIVASAIMAAAPLRAEIIDRVLALVGGQIITLTDVTAARELRLQTVGAAADAAASPDPVRAVLSKLIDRELMLNEVERYAPPEPSPEAVGRELELVRGRFGSTPAFDAVLARSGIDEKQLREILRQDLRIRAYEEQRFAPSDPRREMLIEQWIAGLRRRGDVLDLYLSNR